jgi:hypothetical protein
VIAANLAMPPLSCFGLAKAIACPSI